MPDVSSRRSRAAALVVAFVYLAPIAYAVLWRRQDAIFNLFAADAYYYLTIAKRTALGALPTFDGANPTNGFHPLWQWLLVVLARFANGDKETLVALVFLVDCAAASAGIYLLARTIYEEQRRVLLPLFLVPGIFHLLAPQAGLYAISAWRLVNGMETALSLLLIAVLIRGVALTERERGREQWNDTDFLALGCTAALAVWARLDNFALVATLPMLLVRSRHALRAAACLLGPPIAALTVYVAANLAAGLPPLPVSGVSKSGMFLRGNFHLIVDTLVSPFGSWLGHDVPAGWRLRSSLLAALLTGCLLSLSLAAAAFVGARSAFAGKRERPRHLIYIPILFFIVARLFYYVAFVRLPAQGFWYYVDVAIALNAIVLLQIEVSRLRARAWNAAIGLAWLVAYARAAEQLVAFTVKHEWCPHVIARQAERITRCLEAREPEPKILDSSDGVFAFFLDFPAEPGTGLTATADGYMLRATRGPVAYYKWLIRQGYDVETDSPACNSGVAPAVLVKEPIDCQQGARIRLKQLAIPETAHEARNEGRRGRGASPAPSR